MSTPEEARCARFGHCKANSVYCIGCGAILDRKAIPPRPIKPEKKAKKR